MVEFYEIHVPILFMSVLSVKVKTVMTVTLDKQIA